MADCTTLVYHIQYIMLLQTYSYTELTDWLTDW